MKKLIASLLCIHLALLGFSQIMDMGLGYEIMGNYNTRTIVKEKLLAANSLKDINPGYPASWIDRYVSVKLSASSPGEFIIAEGEEEELSEEQKNLIQKADFGTLITVDVEYYPESGLNKNEVKTIHFSYTVVPKFEANYPGGYPLLKKYLKENAVDKIPKNFAKNMEQAMVSFNINEAGYIYDSQLVISSGDKKVDQILLQCIQKMPKWNPAKDADGLKVEQEFKFTVGNMIGC